MIDKLKEEASRHGDRITLISLARLPEVKKTFDNLGIKPLPFFTFAPAPESAAEPRSGEGSPPESAAEPRSGEGSPQKTDWALQSVIIAASQSRRFSVSFDDDGRDFKAIIPASYSDDAKKNQEIKKYLEVLLENEGYHIRQGKGLPCKALAAHTGLGVYGRNNLIYVEGFGSFLNLNIFFTDMPANDEPFIPFQISDTCKDCNLCVKNCPSGALSEERFFVEAPRCLTMVNEDERPFPDWVEASWHHTLIGCERCQLSCPNNQGLLEPVEEIARYNREETEAFLHDELPSEALEPLGIAYYRKALARNLKTLLAGSIHGDNG